MLRRALSSGPIMSGVICALLASVATDSPARAECIVQPNQQAPDGAHWSLHYDRAKNRRCWILADAAGHDISTLQIQSAPESTALSTLQSILGSFTGAPQTSPPPEAPAAAGGPAASPLARRPLARVVSTSRPEHPARSAQKDKGDGRPAHDLTDPEREALFEEFLRWHESQRIIGTVKPSQR